MSTYFRHFRSEKIQNQKIQFSEPQTLYPVFFLQRSPGGPLSNRQLKPARGSGGELLGRRPEKTIPNSHKNDILEEKVLDWKSKKSRFPKMLRF